jgi:hypothetical protein
MKHLTQMFMKLMGAPTLGRSGHYLARSFNAHDLKFRVHGLERYRG